MLARQSESDLEPPADALPIGCGRPPELLLGFTEEALAQQKEGIVQRRLVRKVLGKGLAADPKPARNLVEVECRHPLLLHHRPRGRQDRVDRLLPVALPAFLEGRDGRTRTCVLGCFTRHGLPRVSLVWSTSVGIHNQCCWNQYT